VTSEIATAVGGSTPIQYTSSGTAKIAPPATGEAEREPHHAAGRHRRDRLPRGGGEISRGEQEGVREDHDGASGTSLVSGLRVAHAMVLDVS
jgi:hypothetical protein